MGVQELRRRVYRYHVRQLWSPCRAEFWKAERKVRTRRRRHRSTENQTWRANWLRLYVAKGRTLHMHRKVRLKVVALACLALLGGCPSQSHFPAEIAPPLAATDFKATGGSDGSLYEASFLIQVEPNSYLVANRLESQLAEAGYRSCGSKKRSWETLRHRVGEEVVEEVRLLRFYQGRKPSQLGVLLATQICDRAQSKCVQRFLVRQIDVAKSQVDDGYIRKICAQ